ncbi:MAG: TolC family protein [Bacteroidetes bacterium]|nr:TolC family protein [Bacteroidota bacterium]
MTTLGVMAGCVVPREAGFPDVSQAVRQRTGYDVQWIRGEAEDAEVAAAVTRLLSDSLIVEEAVQIALLNNRRLQATYENLGVAQAEVVQAGLLRNPIFGGAAAWPLEGGGSPDLAFSVAFDFLGVLTIPLRRSVAASAFEAEKARVSEAVLNLAAQARTGYYRAQADAQLLELMEQVLQAGEAAYLAAQHLREAGNIRTLDLLNEQAQVEQARLDLMAAELALEGNREQLNRLMGLSGGQTNWQLPQRLEEVPKTALAPADIASLASEASLSLAALRHEIETYGRRLGLTNIKSLVPDLHVGAALERDDGEWELGPEVEIALPLFDQGQARRAAGMAELRRRRAEYVALAVETQSIARAAQQQLMASRQAALRYQSVLVPLRSRITRETQLQYNAMQLGVFQLLQTRQMEIDAGRRYVETLFEFWRARTAVDLLIQGGMPESVTSSRPSGMNSSATRSADGH